MKNPFILIAIFILGGTRLSSQEPMFTDTPPVAPHAPPATPGEEAEIKKLIESLVISEKEARANSAEEARAEKARAEAEIKKGSSPDPYAAEDTPPEAEKELRAFYKTREDAYDKLTSFGDLAFPLLSTHLDDERPSRKYWNHTYAKTVGRVCYRIIHDQLTAFPPGYTEYGLTRLGRDGERHKKPYWAATPYNEAGGLGPWLKENQGLTFIEKRIKCLVWQLEEEKKIGAIDPEGYYVNIQPLELEILKLKAAAGQDVAKELERARELFKSRPGDQVPKELLPDGPLPDIEKAHSLQETSAMLKSCPDGHTTLRDVPILYGSFAVLLKKPENWSDEDKALAKRRDDGEVILGGEIDSAKDPRFQPACQTCGYRYQIMAVPDLGGNWFKEGKAFADFTTPFSEAARTLPFAGAAGADFVVEVTKSGKVASETITLAVPAGEKAGLVGKIEKWIDENGFDRALMHVETPPRPRLHEQRVEGGRAAFYIDVHTFPEKNITRFLFILETSSVWFDD